LKGTNRVAAQRWLKRHQRLELVVFTSVLCIGLGLWFSGSLSKGPVTVEAGVLTPSPGFSGANSSNVFFTISYSGVGFGNFTYVISYNGTGGAHSNSENVLVKTGTSFTYDLYVPSQAGSVSIVQVLVYRGNSQAQSDLIFQKTLTV